MDDCKRKYLVCVDEHEECLIALRLACLKVKHRGGKVTLLHVIPPADFQTLGAIAERMREERLSEGYALLERLKSEAEIGFGVTTETILLEGTAGDKIVEAAMADNNVIMIALGVASHKQTGRGKLTAWLVSQLGVSLFLPILMVPSDLSNERLQTLI